MSTRLISSNSVVFRAIIPKKLNINGMSAPIRDVCIKAAKDMGKDLEKVTKTWEGEVPRIQTEAVLVPSNTPPYPNFHTSFTASAWPRADGSMGWKKWLWLDKGTRVRYATMTKPFVAKTRKGLLTSVRGKGGLLFVSKKYPRPGIKARNFTVALRKKWEQPFKERIQKAVEKAAKASGHSAR